MSARHTMTAEGETDDAIRLAFVQGWYDEHELETAHPLDLLHHADSAGFQVDSGKVNKDGRVQKSEQIKTGHILTKLVDRTFRMADGTIVEVERGKPPQDARGSRWRLVWVQGAQGVHGSHVSTAREETMPQDARDATDAIQPPWSYDTAEALLRAMLGAGYHPILNGNDIGTSVGDPRVTPELVATVIRHQARLKLLLSGGV